MCSSSLDSVMSAADRRHKHSRLSEASLARLGLPAHPDLLSLRVCASCQACLTQLACCTKLYRACLQDRTGRTALHWAAESNHIETARTLLDFGIELKTEECMGRC
jgi:hypothetical protein